MIYLTGNIIIKQMKKVNKQIKINCISLEIEKLDIYTEHEAVLTINTAASRLITKPDKLSLFFEVDEPETLKEFMEVNNLTKKELFKWLMDNYK
jgi:hypothetical protein